MGHGVSVLAAGLLLGAAVAASLMASRLRLPALLVFLGIGMAVGSDGAGWVVFDDYGVARDAGMLALALILFDGGLGTGIEELRPVIRPALRLAVFATIGGAILAGVTASVVLGMPVRRGSPMGVGGLVDVVRTPMYATGVGLVRYGVRNLGVTHFQRGDATKSSVWQRMRSWFGEVF